MPNYRSPYRRTKTALSVSVKVIIILLVVLVLTLLAFLIKIIASKALDPQIVYPPEGTETYTVVPHTDVLDTPQTEDDEIKVRGISKVEFDTKEGTLVLVNKKTAYSAKGPQSLVNLYDQPHDNFTLATISEELDREAYEALCRMCDAYADRSGYCPLMITSGYRDFEAQQKYYDGYVVNESDRAYVELPGYSDHHTGLGFDVKLYDKDGASYPYGRYATERAEWIVENHKYYGFIMRYPANKADLTGISGESNHFRYVGVPHSVYITENNICLEEYLTLIKGYTYEDPLHVTSDRDEYAVWYCGGDTVFVPKDKDFTVSGDNLGGFIVTVKL